MGWERKRGKLHELNRLLRGATDTTFIADRRAARRACRPACATSSRSTPTRGCRATPRAGWSARWRIRSIARASTPSRQRVVEGYAILQPRVTPSLPIGREGSLFQRVFSGPSGIDPYAAAVSDVYQDLFGEGSYTGKGIYDVDAFEAALAGRVPENALLSHDLFEGIFARAGLASDVEVVEEFPVALRRGRRAPASLGARRLAVAALDLRPPRRRRAARCRSIGRWKMLDNLRRSLLGAGRVAGAGRRAGCCRCRAALIWTRCFVLAAIAIPAFAAGVFSRCCRAAPASRLRSHLRALAGDLRLAAAQTVLLDRLPGRPGLADGRRDRAHAVAPVRERRHLLEWMTAAQAAGSAATRPAAASIATWRGGVGARRWRWRPSSLAGAGGVAASRCRSLLLWLRAPAIALWVSRSPRRSRGAALSTPDDARRCASSRAAPGASSRPSSRRRTTCCRRTISRKTRSRSSRTAPRPTNIGLYLLSAVAARDFGWIGTLETVERLEATLATMQRLQRFRGHFYNWYDTRDLRPLEPRYVSSVDSGNLAGHLIALANACDEWRDGPCRRRSACAGIADALRPGARGAATRCPTIAAQHGRAAASTHARRDRRRIARGAQAIERRSRRSC